MIQGDTFKISGVFLRLVNKEAIHLNILPSFNLFASLQNTTQQNKTPLFKSY